MLDLSKPQNAHMDQRLRSEQMMWLSTVRPDGRPHMVPVWFSWDGEHIIIFSQRDKQKLRNIQHNPHVMLALDTADGGGDIVMIEGTAELLGPTGRANTLPGYKEKYGADIGMNAERMANEYPEEIRITPTRFIGWSE